MGALAVTGLERECADEVQRPLLELEAVEFGEPLRAG